MIEMNASIDMITEVGATLMQTRFRATGIVWLPIEPDVQYEPVQSHATVCLTPAELELPLVEFTKRLLMPMVLNLCDRMCGHGVLERSLPLALPQSRAGTFTHLAKCEEFYLRGIALRCRDAVSPPSFVIGHEDDWLLRLDALYTWRIAK